MSTLSKQVTTEELLSRATARPWQVGGPYPDVSIIHCVDGGSDVEPPTYEPIAFLGGGLAHQQAAADAELICRAVGSFEAMREVCCELIRKYETAAEEHAVREGVLAMADGLPYGETAVLPESPLVQLARKALALANNTEH